MRCLVLGMLGLMALSACAADELPPVIASSKFINLRAYVEDGPLCVDDQLEAMDQFVAQTAELLGVEPPAQPLELVVRDPGNRVFYEDGVIYSQLGSHDGIAYGQWHELVHAVEIPGLGRGHQLLQEGIADYLGTFRLSRKVPEGFETTFPRLVDNFDWLDGHHSYPVARHFVGAIIEERGMAKFKELRTQIAPDASFKEFAATYRAIYGEELGAALARMSDKPLGGALSRGCESKGEPVAWDDGAESLRVDLAAECGDGFFFGGLETERSSFHKTFVVDIPQGGVYEVVLRGAEVANIEGCDDNYEGLISGLPSGNTAGPLSAGLHTIDVAFLDGGPSKFSLELNFLWGPLP